MDTLSKVIVGVVSAAVAVASVVAAISGRKNNQTPYYNNNYQYPVVQPNQPIPFVPQNPIQNQPTFQPQQPTQKAYGCNHQECTWEGDDNLYQYCTGPKNVYSTGFNSKIMDMNTSWNQQPNQFNSTNYGYGYNNGNMPQQGIPNVAAYWPNTNNMNVNGFASNPNGISDSYGYGYNSNPYANMNQQYPQMGPGGMTAQQPNPFPYPNQPNMATNPYMNNEGFASDCYGMEPQQNPQMNQQQMNAGIPPQTPVGTFNVDEIFGNLRGMNHQNENISQVSPISDIKFNQTTQQEQPMASPAPNVSASNSGDQPTAQAKSTGITGMTTNVDQMPQGTMFQNIVSL